MKMRIAGPRWWGKRRLESRIWIVLGHLYYFLTLCRMMHCKPLTEQLFTLFVLAIPVATIAWTVTHEEVFREPREWCASRSKVCRSLAARKFFFLFTCEYCFSHYVALAALFVTRFQLLYAGWRGYVVAWFSLVWVANIYMSLYARLRLEIRDERAEAEKDESLARAAARREALETGERRLPAPHRPRSA